jgi:hypothetical protein
LFREQFDVNDLEQIRKKPKQITNNTIQKLLGNRLHRSEVLLIEEHKEGDINDKKRKPIARAHGFRKFVNTTFINARLNDTIRNMLLGHSTELDDVYYTPKPENLLGEYLKAVDLLTINDENRLRRENEMLKVRDRVAKGTGRKIQIIYVCT